MKLLAGLGAVAMLAALTACETTGNPRQGGLFGWSETKARQRQAEKQSHVAGAEATLARESTASRTLEARDATTNRQLADARQQRAREEKNLRALQSSLVTRTDKLEADSPTDALASRARAYRLRVNTIAAQTWQTPQQRIDGLHEVEVDIDKALVRAKQPRQR